MKQTLIRKYMEGESSGNEERELKRLLQHLPESERNEEERALLRLLEASDTSDEEDIFETDHAAEYDRTVKRRRIRRLWPWAAAACAASVLAVCLVPRGYDAPYTLSQNTPLPQTTETRPPVQPAKAILPAPVPAAPRHSPKTRPAAAPADPPAENVRETPPETGTTPEEIAAVELKLRNMLEKEKMIEGILDEIKTNTYRQPPANEYAL